MAWHGVQLPHHWLEFVSTLVGGRGRRDGRRQGQLLGGSHPFFCCLGCLRPTAPKREESFEVPLPKNATVPPTQAAHTVKCLMELFL